jgi:hypothetical protein
VHFDVPVGVEVLLLHRQRMLFVVRDEDRRNAPAALATGTRRMAAPGTMLTSISRTAGTSAFFMSTPVCAFPGSHARTHEIRVRVRSEPGPQSLAERGARSGCRSPPQAPPPRTQAVRTIAGGAVTADWRRNDKVITVIASVRVLRKPWSSRPASRRPSRRGPRTAPSPDRPPDSQRRR